MVSLDEGSFTILKAGERIGRESFSIRSASAATGPVLVAQGTIVVGTRQLRPALNADTSGAVLRYQNEVRIDGRVVESYSGQLAREHFAARTQRDAGESLREFRLLAGTVVVDDQILHHLWFVTRLGPGAKVRALAPGRNVAETITVELVAHETLVLDLQEFRVRHLRLRTTESGLVREVWLDDRGRLLRVAIPAEQLVATRDDIR